MVAGVGVLGRSHQLRCWPSPTDAMPGALPNARYRRTVLKMRRAVFIFGLLLLAVTTFVSGAFCLALLTIYLGMGWYRAPVHSYWHFDAWPVWTPALLLAPICV